MRPSLLCILVACLIEDVASFHLNTNPQYRSRGPIIATGRALDAASPADDDEVNSDSTAVEWGVSFIGGDPCGSKYNNDPFAADVQKPGMPDDMKARIAALAAKRLKEQKVKKEEE
jgi:hypothetical protein